MCYAHLHRIYAVVAIGISFVLITQLMLLKGTQSQRYNAILLHDRFVKEEEE